jgi:phosphomannomutase
MLESIARAHGAHCERTMTGFKWLWTAAVALEAEQSRRFCFGYEEALGYSVARAVRDKDGISAALAFAALANDARLHAQSVLERLQALYEQHGLWASVQHSVVLKGVTGAARIREAMAALRAKPPARVLERAVTSLQDFAAPTADEPVWRGATDLVMLGLERDARLLVRPSGTEPKLKIYVDLRTEIGQDEPFSVASERASAEALALAKGLEQALGLA